MNIQELEFKNLKFIFGVIAVLFLFFGLSAVRPALAQNVAQDVKTYAESMKNDAGALSAVTELFGKDAPVVKKFQLGVKLGEFIIRVSQGDVLGAATDLAKYELEQAVDIVKGKLFGPFATAADLGKWLGEEGRNMHFVSVFNDGYEIYKREGGMGEFYLSEIAGWWDKSGNKFEKEKGGFPVWKKVFKNLYEAEKLAAGIKQEDIQKAEQVKKDVKKEVFVTFFKTKYPGFPTTVAEELAELIVKNASNAEVEKLIDEHKAALEKLSIAKPSGALSSSGICGVIKDDDNRKYCEGILAEIVDLRSQVFSNKITYRDYFKKTDGLKVIYLKDIGDENLTEFKKEQESIIASAYEFQFGREIRAINDSFVSLKDEFQSLKNDHSNNLPGKGGHWNSPSYRVSVNTGFTRVFNNAYNKVFNYGSYDYEDFKSGAVQKNYQEYLENETKANAADDARARYLKTHLGKANGLVRDFIVLQNKINSFISSAESSKGVFSYGQTSLDDLKKKASEIEGLKKDIQSGEKQWWQFWRSGAWSIDSVSEVIKEMESNKKAREALISQLEKDYASALKTYEDEEKQRKQEAEEMNKLLEEREQQRKREEQKQPEERKGIIPKIWDTVKNLFVDKEAKPTPSEKVEVKTTPGKETAEQEKERLLKESADKEAVTKKRLEEARRKAAEEQKRLEETKPSQASGILSGTMTVPDSFDVYISSVLFTKDGARLVDANDEKSPYVSEYGYGSYDFARSYISGLHSGSEQIGGILEIGQGQLATLNSVPSSGYKYFNEYSMWTDYYRNKEYIYPKAGYLYAIKTHDGKYAAIEVISVSDTQLQIKWKYQPNGSNSF